MLDSSEYVPLQLRSLYRGLQTPKYMVMFLLSFWFIVCLCASILLMSSGWDDEELIYILDNFSHSQPVTDLLDLIISKHLSDSEVVVSDAPNHLCDLFETTTPANLI